LAVGSEFLAVRGMAVGGRRRSNQ